MEEGLRELKLLSQSVSSPNMDGMPRAGSSGDAMTRVVARIAAQERSVALQKGRVTRAQVYARRIVRRLTGAFRAFCEDYYVNGYSFDIAQAACGVRDRQCKNYMTIVKNKADSL